MQSEGACEVSCVGVGVELGFGLVFFTCCLSSVECVVVSGAYYISLLLSFSCLIVITTMYGPDE